MLRPWVMSVSSRACISATRLGFLAARLLASARSLSRL